MIEYHRQVGRMMNRSYIDETVDIDEMPHDHVQDQDPRLPVSMAHFAGSTMELMKSAVSAGVNSESPVPI